MRHRRGLKASIDDAGCLAGLGSAADLLDPKPTMMPYTIHRSRLDPARLKDDDLAPSSEDPDLR